MKIATLLLLCLTIFPLPASAADTQKSWGFYPLPVVARSPETGLMLGIASVLWDTAGNPQVPRQNLLMFEAVYTTRNQLALRLGIDRLLWAEKFRLETELAYSRFPDLFFGIGPEADAEEDYTPVEFHAQGSLGRALASQLYLGPAWDFKHSAIRDKEAGGLLAAGTIPGSEGAWYAGGGARLVLDNRDSAVAPRRGLYLTARSLLYGQSGAGGDLFMQSELDARGYFSVLPRQVTALRSVLVLSAGDLCFQAMPLVGGPFLMRGYYQGRYRDADMLVFQAEQRFQIFWRLGGVLFGSLGRVAPSAPELVRGVFRAAGGGGLRFTLDEKTGFKLRVDLGCSSEGPGLYIGSLEAF